jgi:hypothetical protein
MATRELVILTGIGLAAWGHLLLHELFGAQLAWVRMESVFPPAWRSSPGLAGSVLLVAGALLVLVPVLG